MLDLSGYINLPFVWGLIIVSAILLYVLLDGFDLGVGILFPFAPSDECRSKMINSIAPFWDGNETWLVMGGGGLFAAFPTAYSIIMPALYMPILFMLVALVFRGVAFEFRFKASNKTRHYWDLAFHFGSIIATFMQGMILGGLVQGIKVEKNVFSGGHFDWLSGFSFMTGIAMVTAYGLLGASWLFLKTSGKTRSWAAKSAKYLLCYVLLFMGLVSIWMPFIDELVFKRWFDGFNLSYLCIVPIMIAFSAYKIHEGIKNNKDAVPFMMTLFMFMLGFIGLMINTWPYVVPRVVTFKQAAAANESLTFMLIAFLLVAPVILFYTGYSYYVFRGKVKAQDMYSSS